MICPRDKSELKREVFCGVEIDTCPECNGIWLDRGELARVAGMDVDTLGGEYIDINLLKDRKPGEKFDCPRCNGFVLEPCYFCKENKIVIDVCPACDGIWLDAEELKQVIGAAFRQFE